MSDPSSDPTDGAAAATSSTDVTLTLLKLLNSFPDLLHPPQTQITSLIQLNDGLCLFHFLHGFEPTQFDLEPLQVGDTLASDAGMRAGNLQYLLDCLETFFEEVMNVKHIELGFLDVKVLSSGDATEADPQLLNLLEFVLLCAINSSKKEDIIHKIMVMTEDEQQILMNIIHDIQMKVDKDHQMADLSTSMEAGAAGTLTPTRKTSFDQPETPAASASSTAINLSLSNDSPSAANAIPSAVSTAQAKQAQAQIDALEKTKVELTTALDSSNRELRELKRKAHELQEKLEAQAQTTADDVRKAVASTRDEVTRELTERYKNESQRSTKDLSRSELRIQELESALKQSQEQILSSSRELTKLQELNDEKSNEISTLKDEIHLAESKLETFSSNQAKMEKMKVRLAEIDELKQHNSTLEAENSKQLDRIIELESEAKEIDKLKSELNRQRDTILQNESVLLDKTLQEELSKNELRELKEELTLIRSEHKAMEQELKSTKAELEQRAKFGGAGSASGASSNSVSNDLSDVSTSTGSSDDKATIRRLEYELNKLRESSASASTSTASSSELSLLKSQKETLQEKYLDSQRKLASQTNEHEKRVKEMQEKLSTLEKTLEEEREKWTEEKEELVKQGNKSEEVAQLRQECIELHEQLDTLRAGSSTPAAATDATSPTKTSAAAKAAADFEALSTRSKKLESVIKKMQISTKLAQDERDQARQAEEQARTAYNSARQQLINRERELVEREKSRVLDTANATKERKLMSSAFYTLGFEHISSIMAGRAVTKNGTATPIGRSWLSQQRNAPANQ